MQPFEVVFKNRPALHSIYSITATGTTDGRQRGSTGSLSGVSGSCDVLRLGGERRWLQLENIRRWERPELYALHRSFAKS